MSPAPSAVFKYNRWRKGDWWQYVMPAPRSGDLCPQRCRSKSLVVPLVWIQDLGLSLCGEAHTTMKAV